MEEHLNHNLMTIAASGIPQKTTAARIPGTVAAVPVLPVPKGRLDHEGRWGPKAFPVQEGLLGLGVLKGSPGRSAPKDPWGNKVS